MSISSLSYAQFYNGTQTSFGKNRLQYQTFKWQFFRFNNLETYFYEGGLDFAKHTAYYANERIPQMEKFIDYYLEERVQFIIFNKQADFRQSNIGLSTDESYNIGGANQIVGSKVFIYFEGDYKKLEQQIDAGILRVLIYQMLYGGNWREVLRNSALMSLPEWYIEGLISYLSNPNDPLVNSRIKDGIQRGDFQKFNRLNKEDATIAGHAMWQFIAETYGESVISNILYMTRLSREINDGFLYVIGLPFEDLYIDWYNHFSNEFGTELPKDQLGEKAPFKQKKRFRYQNFKASDDNRYYAFTTNKLGRYKIYLYDKESGKKTKIFAAEHKLERVQDYSYPIIDFHPTSKLLSFITEDKGQVILYHYNIEDETLEAQPVFRLAKVLNFDYSPNGRQMIFSAVAGGQSDLYLYTIIGNTQQKLTDDVYADLDPVFNQEGDKIFFSSNRNNDSLNLNSEIDRFAHEKDIFVYDFSKPEAPILEVSNTDESDELSPLYYKNKLLFLEQQGAKSSRYQAKFDSAVARVDTAVHYRYFYNIKPLADYERNILYQSENDEEINQISFLNERYFLSTEKNPEAEKNVISDENQETFEINKIDLRQSKELITIQPKEVEKKVNIEEYTFFDGLQKAEEKTIKRSSLSESKVEGKEDLKFPTQRIYRLNFRPDNSVLQLNNMFITQQYQVFNGGPYINPGVGVNTKIGMVDLMENHRIYGGFRYAGSLLEYSVHYQNLEKRLDKEYSISRRRLRNTDAFYPFDTKTMQANVSLIWPFSEVTSLRGVISARNDRNIPLSSDQINLEREIQSDYWASAKLAYVFDNTRDVALNIRYGTRFKIFAEQYQLVYNETDNSATDLSVFGVDFRHYQKIHREFIGVFRFAASKSIGSNPLVYYLGGVDEWWRNDIFDENTPIDPNGDMNYGFQAMAANMRGFEQNVRNGNNFALINAELRLPVFSYFINRPIQSDFLRNFQVIGFGDVGTAWMGASPFEENNPSNNEEFTTGPITVTYENINDPIVGGLGFGLRTTLLGYFVRADWGWGVENGLIADKPLFMLSLSLDI